LYNNDIKRFHYYTKKLYNISDTKASNMSINDITDYIA
jgi:hypothetical protein